MTSSLAAAAVAADTRPGVLGAFALRTETTPLCAGARETPERAVLVGVVADPVEVVVVLDGGVVGVEHDYLVPDLATVRADPVRVEHPEVGVLSGAALLGDAFDTLSPGEPVDPLTGRASAGLEPALAGPALADADPRDDHTLFCLVPQCACPVETGRSLDSLDGTLVAPLLLSLPL